MKQRNTNIPPLTKKKKKKYESSIFIKNVFLMFYYIKQGFSNLLNDIPLNQGSCFRVLPGDKHKTNIGKIVKTEPF